MTASSTCSWDLAGAAEKRLPGSRGSQCDTPGRQDGSTSVLNRRCVDVLPLRHPAGTVGGVTAPPVRHVSLRSGVYADSVRLMQVSRDVGAREGVSAVLVAMATPLNLELAAGMGLAPAEAASPDQLLVAAAAVDDAALAAAVTAVDAALAARERAA